MNLNNDLNTALATYTNSSLSKTSPGNVTRAVLRDNPVNQTDDSGGWVTLSSTSTHYSNSIASYTAYFPARPGMAADALVLGVSQPGAISSSKGMSFPEVAADARSRLDDKYALMKSSGKPYDGSDTDRNSLLGDLDRRSLYAVATNSGGQFSAEEQAAAKGLMAQQERLATGYYSGPEDQQKNFADPYANDPVGRAKAALAFLENMSPEEKAAPEWLVQHQTLSDALAQTGSDNSAVKKDKGHFHNLSEILAGIDTDGSEEKQSGLGNSDSSNSYVFEQVQADLRAQQSASGTE